MDPLSLTASIIAVLQMTAKLTGYLNDMTHATSEQKKLALESSNLYGLLTNLRFRVEEARSNDEWFNQVKFLGVDNGPLAQFKDILEKMVKEINPSRARDRVKSALLWKFTKTDVEEALASMERLKSLIAIALTNDAFALSRAIHSDVATLTTQTADLQVHVSQLNMHATRDLQNQISRWLQIPDPSSNFQAALSKRHAQTGSWLLQSRQLQTWQNSPSSLLWLHGKAGCGKTVLSATVLQHIFDHVSTNQGFVIAYFYFDFNDAEKQITRNAIRSLLFQLALQLPDVFSKLEHLYQKCNEGSQQPPNEAILSMLHKALASPCRKYVIFDALDECTDRDTLLPLVRELAVSPQYTACMLATSRRELDIEQYLKPVVHIEMDVQSAQVDNDISVYVRDQLATDIKLQKWPAAVKKDIVEELMKKADGMFRWAFCQLQSLRNCIKLSGLKKVLSSLPATLDETYARILRQIESSGQLADAVNVLQWLCFSRSSLVLSEIVEVLAIERGEHGGFCSEERLPDPKDVMTICSSLISCRNVKNEFDENLMFSPVSAGQENDGERSQDQDNVDFPLPVSDREQNHEIEVRLAHFSVKEYLLSERCFLKSDFQEQVCHKSIAESCLHYLHFVVDQVPADYLRPGEVYLRQYCDACDEDSEYPLTRYAVTQWRHHAKSSGNMSGTPLPALASSLLTTDIKSSFWLQHDSIDLPWSNKEFFFHRESNDTGSPLYYAAAVGLVEVVRQLLNEGVDVDSRGGLSISPLKVASYLGNETVVRLLLDKGANINEPAQRSITALQAACWGNQETVVRLLLQRGADVNAQGIRNFGEDYKRLGGTALQIASQWENEGIMRLLIEKGADIDAVGAQDVQTVLQETARRGNEVLARLLLENGANVNAAGINKYGTALQAASYRGHEAVVRLLLEKGAEVNAAGSGFSTALQAASAGGHTAVVLLLLENGANINAVPDEGFGTALIAATYNGHEAVVRLLLEKGADANPPAEEGRQTALTEAARYDYEAIVRLLLDKGANTSNTSRYYGPALQAAVERKRESIVRLLLDKSTNVNDTSEYFGCTLPIAVIHSDEAMVRLLLDNGANVDSTSQGYRTALHNAADRGNEAVVRLLLEKGADINRADENYGSALQVASSRGHEAIVRLLLEKGADVNVTSETYRGTALQSALNYGHKSIVRLLRQHGAQILMMKESEEGEQEDNGDDVKMKTSSVFKFCVRPRST